MSIEGVPEDSEQQGNAEQQSVAADENSAPISGDVLEEGVPELSNVTEGNGSVSREIFTTVTEELEKARSEATDYWNRLLRMQAEMENMRKRNQRALDNAHKYSLEKFSAELLGVVDSLDLGLQAAKKEGSDVKHIVEGTELTLKMFLQTLDKFDIEEINPLGEKFDPALHQAMGMLPAAEGIESNTVITVMQKGYQLHERLLRPALVMVAK
ncbi:MAG: nucleotide exchange factor GrpE [Gammaproteobacteria bacterium]|nr:nucleotide exchange factor GrpE [Gammaproteobacteria bacterium]